VIHATSKYPALSYPTFTYRQFCLLATINYPPQSSGVSIGISIIAKSSGNKALASGGFKPQILLKITIKKTHMEPCQKVRRVKRRIDPFI